MCGKSVAATCLAPCLPSIKQGAEPACLRFSSGSGNPFFPVALISGNLTLPALLNLLLQMVVVSVSIYQSPDSPGEMLL